MALSVSTSPELSTLKFSDQGTLILSSSETKKGNSAINSSDIFQIIPTYALSNIRVSVDAYGGFWSRTYINASADWSGGTPLYVSAISGQTGDLTKWQNSAGTTLARIASNGVMKANVGLLVENSTLANYTALQVTSTITNGTGIIVTGASGQTANLQEWQNNGGTVLASIDSNGIISLPGGSWHNLNGLQTWYKNVVSFYQKGPSHTFRRQSDDSDLFTIGGNGNVSVLLKSASAVGLIVKAAASQTANLQEWQNSSGTALARIKSNGNLIINADGFSAVENTTSAVKINSNTAQNADEEVLLRFHRSGVSSTTYGGGVDFKVSQWQSTSAGAGYVPYTQLTIALKSGATDNESANINVLTLRDNSTIGINNTTPSAQLDINIGSSSRKGLIVKAAASQTANLQEWQDSSGTVLSNITADGWFETNNGNGIRFYGPSRTAWSTLANNLGNLGFNYAFTVGNSGLGANLGTLTSYAISASTIGLVVRGAASQTANLQEWQDSTGTVIAKVTSGGSFTSYNTNFFARTFFLQDGSTNASTQISGAYFAASSANSAIYARTTSASIVPLVVQGTTSQSANLQEWQNVSATTLALVDAYGRLGINTTSLANSTGAYSMLSVYNNNTVNTNLTIKAYASQTANMQEWQNSAGTVLTRIASDGSIYRGATTIDSYGAIYTTETMAIGASSGQRFATGGMTIINREQASAIIFGVKGIASQTGDLTQWRNSSDTILAKVDANGNFSAITKSFDIPHPTKENMRLRYASLEGPENGVYVRGTAESNIIELPEYWTGLVHEDSITVSLTAVGSAQNIYVEKIENNKVYIGGEFTKAFFTVYGERKDIDKLTVEY